MPRFVGSFVVGALFWATSASAQPLQNNDYSIDLYQGPVLAPIRVTGIAGAYAGYAEGIQGFVANAAAPAVREPFSFKHFEMDIAGSLSIPVDLFENNDFDNSGDLDFDYSNFIYANAGGMLQVGWFGTGAIGEVQRYSITDFEGTSNQITIGRYHLLAAIRLLDGQLMVGGGARGLTVGIDAPDANLTLFGAGPELGFLVRPNWESYRLGATLRLPVIARDVAGRDRGASSDGVKRVGGLVLPDDAVLPWELEVGMAIQVGPRPLNPAWPDPTDQEDALRQALEERRKRRTRKHQLQLARVQDPDERALRRGEQLRQEPRLRVREDQELERDIERAEAGRRARYDNWPRERILVTMELLVSGATSDGVSLEQFLGQNQRSVSSRSVVGTAGAEVNWSPRFGIETEPVPNLLATRFGSYYEPTRFSGPVGRQHFTFGSDLRLFSTTFWGLVPKVTYKLQASADVAPRYQSVSGGIGVWH